MTDARIESPRLWRIATFGGRIARRTALILWLFAAIGAALLLGWQWVVAAGLSTLVLAVLPCAAMCAAGLCGGKRDPADAAPGTMPEGRDA